MITNLDPASALFLANVDRVQQSIAVANQQVSSGKKINVASDAPDQISTLLQLRASLQHNSQVQSNLTSAQADASSADSALSSAITMMDQALTLGNGPPPPPSPPTPPRRPPSGCSRPRNRWSVSAKHPPGGPTFSA